MSSPPYIPTAFIGALSEQPTGDSTGQNRYVLKRDDNDMDTDGSSSEDDFNEKTMCDDLDSIQYIQDPRLHPSHIQDYISIQWILM